ncbi:flagellar basal body rod protein FlgB [Pokkaliibacter plantistimulans]|uniref:Flagellar basal body rod protein FlgB n=1 Tax=Pokkaliibacter plantistimulans TaxID=1635171 RepID=A0ABX5M1Q5_9GAMM|nr:MULTISPECIES: flagellar basal body rod protein FlgB [Pokkaliibacter]MDH2431329.1 flagellar basal body rod protein FlgB [Pokkaliibacter sp. MBI-7]PXF32416.1 flagellar basal body rod protein FlgB [Pokkaliibacter plantistimulans]
MAIGFDQALGIHADALLYRAKRAEVLANNLANADTPNFKARDLDFSAFLDRANEAASSVTLRQTNAMHFAGEAGSMMDDQLLYRVPVQPAVDGNTVDPEVEKSNFMENAMDYQASFMFLNKKFVGLSNAIKGGQ